MSAVKSVTVSALKAMMVSAKDSCFTALSWTGRTNI